MSKASKRTSTKRTSTKRTKQLGSEAGSALWRGLKEEHVAEAFDALFAQLEQDEPKKGAVQA